MASYLVTGGAGFIGSHLTEELVRRGHRVRVADSLITGKRAQSRPHPRRRVPGRGPGAICRSHSAPSSAWTTFCTRRRFPRCRGRWRIRSRRNRANVDATLNVLVAARDAGVKRLVFAGSSSEYGNAPTLPKREDMAPSPLSPYALQKRDRDRLLPDVLPPLRLRDGGHPLLQRLRTAAGSGLGVLRGHLAVCDGAHRRPPADHLRRRRADARLHLRRQRRRRRAARLRGAGGGRRGDQRRLRRRASR